MTSKKAKAKGASAPTAKAMKEESATKDSGKKVEFTPDMLGKVRYVGHDLEQSGQDEIIKVIRQHPILSQYIGYFEGLSEDELRSIVRDATQYAIGKMEERL